MNYSMQFQQNETILFHKGTQTQKLLNDRLQTTPLKNAVGLFQDLVTIKANDELKTILQFTLMKVSALTEICTLLVKILQSGPVHALQRKHQPDILKTIERNKKVIPHEKLLQLMGITRQRLYYFRKKSCKRIPGTECRKKRYNQVTFAEVDTMREYLEHPEMQYWPLSSISDQMMRDGTAFVSTATLRRYGKIMGIVRPSRRRRREMKRAGIRASGPGLILHMDVTVFKPVNGVKLYIHILMDNYSRCILGYLVSQRCCSANSAALLKEVFEKYGPILNESRIEMITDDGQENYGETKDFYERYVQVKHLVAQKDIDFSNSLVEAAHKSIKYGFLFRKELRDREELQTYLSYAIDCYNHRPHSALHGLTPMEVLYGAVPDKARFDTEKAEARAKRKEANLRENCGPCY